MSGEFLKAQAAAEEAAHNADGTSIVIGQIVNNCDHTVRGRVKVRLASKGGLEIWARLALLDHGAYFIPQKGDEVLVAVSNKNVNEAYVLGRLWNDTNQLPRKATNDPNTKRVIRTPGNHEIAFDEDEQSVVIKTGNGQIVALKPNSVQIGVDDKSTAKITLDGSGNLTIEATNSITIRAPTVDVDTTNLTLGGKSSVRIDGGSYCSVAGKMIYIG